jgi:NAD+ synthase (glutamine-hydrolysing)
MRDGFIKVAAGTPEIRVADCAYNTQQCIDLIRQAEQQGVKVLCLPELCLTGYTCGDLFLQTALLDGAEAALQNILEETRTVDMLICLGLPVRHHHKLFNCAAVLCRGELLGLVPKTYLPNYTEFYEGRWFTSGQALADGGCCIPFAGRPAVEFSTGLVFRCDSAPLLAVGVEICEDLWVADTPSTKLAQGGATVILNPSASDETVCKDAYRRTLLSATSGRLVCGYVYANAGWGESSTDLIYAGHSVIAENGSILAQRRFETGLTVTELDLEKLAHERQRMSTFSADAPGCYPVYFHLEQGETKLTRPVEKNPFVPADGADRAARCQEILTLAALGLKKRLAHTRAKTAVVGLSGGLDSTLALLITARAMELLGRPMTDIVAITMPCFGTTSRTKSNAEVLAERIGATLHIIDIGEAVKVHFRDIGQSMDDLSVTFENGQARERTQVLMDIANQSGGMVIGTGDLSELALGWATYNGDHMSMYAVNAGIPKTLVRHLVAYVADREQERDPKLSAVLRDILDTPVSPELLPPKEGEIAQRTEDLVGPYELHDFFLYYAVRWGFSPGKVFRLAQYALGEVYDRETILKWLNNFYRRFFAQQFKRSCLPDGPKVGSVTLSPRGDWRMPSDAMASLWMAELERL